MTSNEVLDAVVRLYYSNQLAWQMLLGVALISIGYLLTVKKEEWWNAVPKCRGKAMRRARRNYVRAQTVDALVNYIEERVYSGEFTRKEASELYRDARKYWPVKDLFPSPELLKKAIDYRLKNQVHEPSPLPDRKEKVRPKMFAKLKES